MRKLLVLFGIILFLALVGSVAFFVLQKGRLPKSTTEIFQPTENVKLDTKLDILGISFIYPSIYKLTSQSSLSGRQNTFTFSSKDSSYRLLILANWNDIQIAGTEKHGEWVKTSTSLLKKFCETDVCSGATSFSYLLETPNFIYDFIYDDPNLENLIKEIMDTATVDESQTLNKFNMPDAMFSFDYPYNWRLTAKKSSSSKYYTIEFKSADFRTSAFAGNDTYEKPTEGVSIELTLKDSTETDIRAFFNSSQMLSAITSNVKETEWNKNIILEYDFGFEGNVASIAEFLYDGKLYTFKYRYADENAKSIYHDALLSIIKSIKFVDKKK